MRVEVRPEIQGRGRGRGQEEKSGLSLEGFIILGEAPPNSAGYGGQIMVMPTVKESEEKSIRESFNNWVGLYFDTGKRDEEGNRIFKNVDTGQDQVFVDEEE